MLDLKALATESDETGELPTNIAVLTQSNQLKAMTTVIRDKTTNPEDFIFYLERASGLVIQRFSLRLTKFNCSALDDLPYTAKTIETPTGHPYNGKELAVKMCGVEIIRAGGAMQTSFSRIFVDAPIGKVLIQTSEKGEPLVPTLWVSPTNFSSILSNSRTISVNIVSS